MKILIISDYFQPKIGYTKVQISRELIKLGHKVKILTSDRYFPFHNYENTAKKLLGKRIRKPGKRMENGFNVERKKILFEAFTRVIIPNIESSIKKFKPDQVIVIGISTFTCFQVSKLKKKLKFKLIVADSHLPSEFNSGNILVKKIFYYLFRAIFSRTISSAADKVIAIQDKTLDIIKNVYGISKKITVVPNGTNIKLFKFSKAERNKTRKMLKIDLSDFVIIYTGKMIKQKGLHILFEAFNKLKINKKIHLLLLAEGPKEYISFCFSKVDKEKYKQIHMVGFKDQNQLYKYYSAADLAVWPLQESLAMNDAAACSLPFIANNTMGDKTRVSNNNALLYKKNNATDLKIKISKLINDDALRAKMGSNGRKLMQEKLSWKHITKQYL